MVPPDSDKISRVPSYSGYPSSSTSFEYGTFTLYGHTSQSVLLPVSPWYRSYNPGMQAYRFGPIRVRSPLLAKSHVDFFSSRYLDVSVPSVSSDIATLLTMLSLMFPLTGLPHSEISGSKPIWRLPEAYRWLINVLHRLLLPRYPPHTLSSFILLPIFQLDHKVYKFTYTCFVSKPKSRNVSWVYMGSRLLSDPVIWMLKILLYKWWV